MNPTPPTINAPERREARERVQRLGDLHLPEISDRLMKAGKYIDAANVAGASEAIKELLAASSGERRFWQDIATAPRDGFVLGWATDRNRCEIVKLRDSKPFLVGSEFAFDRAPVKHWMPLPPTPASVEEPKV